jgi:maleamate amidohydrolase
LNLLRQSEEANMATIEEELFRERGFGVRIGFGNSPLLLVIDMTKAFTDPSMPLGANLDPQVDICNSLIDTAHHHKIPIIFTTVFYEDDDLRDAGIWALKQRKCLSTLRANSPEVEVDPRLHRLPIDSLLSKKYASCFFGTDFVPRLLSYRADTILITGCATSGCVRATAVDACQYGFRPVVIRDAVGDRSLAAHNQSLFDLQFKYADVLDSDEVLRFMRGLN